MKNDDINSINDKSGWICWWICNKNNTKVDNMKNNNKIISINKNNINNINEDNKEK